jgi:hypothetical protein
MQLLNVTPSQSFSPVQENVLAAIAGGASMKAAAEAATIHRNTISYWRHAQYDKALFIREEAESQVAEAFAAIRAILTKPGASDSARLNGRQVYHGESVDPVDT